MPGKNIFGESFKKYVADQINTRQNKLAITNKYDVDTLKFINNNTPWIRLSSGVDISSEKAANLGIEAGSGAAKKYTLFSARFGNDQENKTTFTKGIGFEGTATSYGFLSNPTYGLVPPPGITSIDIKPGGDKSTLRFATVQLECHNLPQFKVIEALYLRLKYSMLLEWGHSIFFDKNGNLQNAGGQDWIHQGFLMAGANQDSMISAIESAREQSGGNYDGFLGWVRNFNWTLKPNGGYDIILELTSLGDPIESMKLNINYPQASAETTNANQEDTPKPPIIANKNRSTIHQILFAIKSELDNLTYMDGFSTGGKSSLQGSDIVRITKERSKYDLQGVNYKDPNETGNTANNILAYQEGIKLYFDQLKSTDNGSDGYFYYIKLGALLRIIESFLLKYDTSKGSIGAYRPLFYINHDYDVNLCLTLPRQISTDPRICILPASKTATAPPDTSSPEKAKATTTYEKVFFSEIEVTGTNYIEQSPSELITGDTTTFSEDQIIVDYETISDTFEVSGSSVSKITEVVVLYKNGNKKTFNRWDIGSNIGPFYLDRSSYAANNVVLSKTGEDDISVKPSANNTVGLGPQFRVEGEEYAFLGKFMHIHVNMDYISNLLSDTIDTEGKVSIYEFLEKLMQGIQGAIGSINDFRIIYDELSNTFYINDNTTLPNADKYFNVASTTPTVINANVLKNTAGSFVTNVAIKSELNNNFANIVTIGAQSNGNVVGENATAFSKWNVGYTDRVITDRSSIVDDSTQPQSGSVSKPPEEIYRGNLIKYFELNNNINSGTVTSEDISNNTQAVVDMLNYELAYFTQNDNIQGQGFLPINLQLTMLGLSGPRLFETYTIDETLLPDNYKNNVKFLAKSITHKVDSNGWLTTLDSFMAPRLDSLKKPIFWYPPPTSPPTVTGTNTNSTVSGGPGTPTNVNGCKTFNNAPDIAWTPPQVGSSSPESAPAVLKRKKEGYQNGDSGGLVNISSRGNVVLNTNERPLLVKEAAAAFNNWADEITSAGLCFTVSSVFRSYEEQVALKKRLGDKAATPRTSAHGWGIAIDIRELYRLVGGSISNSVNANGRKSKAYKFIASVAAKHGWYNPYRLAGGGSKAEVWHFEYWGN